MTDVSALGDERVLVTGAYGCIGTWVLRGLLEAKAVAVAADIAAGSPRLRLVLDDEHDERLVRAVLDVTDMAGVERVLDEHGITRVIHLAALQVPFCQADPPLGAAVNLVGTVNVLEAVRRRSDRISHVVYASSIAAYDPPNGLPQPTMSALPGTVYGVYKRAGEQVASRYWRDFGLPSVGLRPHTVFGPARDQGLTSAPTMAMLAAAAARPYAIPYGGDAQFQYAPDVARAFVQAAFAGASGAGVHNLRGAPRSVADVVETIVTVCPAAAGSISFADAPLSFPSTVDSDGLENAIGPLTETPFPTAVRETIDLFRVALGDRRIDPAILGP